MTSLDLSKFKTVFDVDFAKIKSLSGTVFNDQWGSGSNFWFSGAKGLLIGGQASNHYAAAGIEQAPTGASAGEGYGLYQFTGAAAMAGQGVGICFVMWRADNVWLDKSNPGQLTELDILESWDGTKTGQATDHYYNTASNQNGQSFHAVSGIDLTQNHTYAMDWEKGSLTYYVDGKELYQITGSSVPKDYADGGCNYTMGAEVVNETGSVGLYIKDMSYSAPISGAPTPSAPVTPAPAGSIAVSAPGTVQEASVGAGVTVTETVAVSGSVNTLYEASFTAAGKQEASWQQVTVQNGKPTTFQAHLAATGDYVEVVDNATNPTIIAKSSAVTITDPASVVVAPTIAVSAPGTVQETSVGAGVTVSETATVTGSLSTVYEAVFTKAGVAESAFTAASVTNGKASFSAHLAHSGDYVVVESSATSPTVKAQSSAVTITDPVVVAPKPVAPVPTAASFTLASVTETGGKLVLLGDKESGSAATVREFMDGKYLGTIKDNMQDGTFSFRVSDVAAGSHTVKLTLDGSSLSASMSFTTGSLATIPAAPVIPGLSISSVTEDSGRLLLSGNKEIGSKATMREYMDGKYLGTVRDGMSDGAFSMHIADVAAGAHVLKLTLDGSTATASYDFTKASTGTVAQIQTAPTHDLIAVSSHS